MTTPDLKIRRLKGLYVIRAGGAVLGETVAALELSEGTLDPVVYFPRADAGEMFLEPSVAVTHCPHKGDATHFHIAAKSGLIRDAAWSYETPLEAVSEIAGYVAFYPGKATVEAM